MPSNLHPQHLNNPALAPLLPGGLSRGLAKGAGLPRRYSACLVLMAVSVTIFLLHTVLLSDARNFGQVPLLGRTIQSWSEDVDEEALSAEQAESLANQRRLLADEMLGYAYGRHGDNVSSLADLVPEQGGTPRRSVVLTTWRSGSTFVGDVLNSHPASWYHYEPLLDLDIVQVRGPPLADRAQFTLKQLLNCNYTGLDHYLEYGKKHVFLFTHNRRLWLQCEAHPNLCWRPEFLSAMCKLFPVQNMKVVRLRVSLAEKLLKDKSLPNVRILLLVRDPRGTMQSRRHRDWCPGNPDCDDPALLCADLANDYYAAVKLSRKYPDRFKVMRYEDISMDPYRKVKEMLRFLQLNFHPAVQLFLDTHTKENVGGVSSTFRDSKVAPFHWRQDLSHRDVRRVQNVCVEAMQLWGYIPALSAAHQLEFNPLAKFKLK
ncbi:carbohydrate sulfotransferase 5-like [Cloeon dipterum]